jgi:site-specific DNA-methyltransferase (adenine-specific)
MHAVKSKSQTLIRLYGEDCVKGIPRHVARESIDIIVTSPPYNLGVKYNTYQDRKKWNDYLSWTVEWARVVRDAMKEDASLFLNLGCAPSSPLLPHAVVNALVEEENLFVLQNTIHWIKSIAIPDANGQEIQKGHYKPINSDRFVNDCHEYVFHLSKGGHNSLDRKAVGVPYTDKTNIDRWKHTSGDDLKCRGNTWFVPYKTISNRAKDRPHPATFPTELASNCIRLHGRNGSSVVLDPFLGIGHASFAAIECGVREFIGFEIDSEYLRIAKEESQLLVSQLSL